MITFVLGFLEINIGIGEYRYMVICIGGCVHINCSSVLQKSKHLSCSSERNFSRTICYIYLEGTTFNMKLNKYHHYVTATGCNKLK